MALLLTTLPFLNQGCSRGETSTDLDGGSSDQTLIPDIAPDHSPSPADLRIDTVVDTREFDLQGDGTPDTQLDTLEPDINPCGNGQIDDEESCDPAILTGETGACPTLSDCDDEDDCTTDELLGTAVECSARCQNTPLETCCGNGEKEGIEGCDDGNQLDSDSCSNDCKLPGGHLLITELAVTPADAEFIEIYNPGATAIVLDNIYLTDRSDYFLLPEGALSNISTDFVARFPVGSTIKPGQYLTIAARAIGFKVAYARAPDYELQSSDGSVPDMASALAPPASSTISGNAGLTDASEFVMLFSWDGSADLVTDVDYVLWATTSPSPASKTTLCIDGPDTDANKSCYLDDTLPSAQSFLRPPNQGGSLHRCNYHEHGETQSGGNGVDGHDETSEPLESTWSRNASNLADRTPGEPPVAGFCLTP